MNGEDPYGARNGGKKNSLADDAPVAPHCAVVQHTGDLSNDSGKIKNFLDPFSTVIVRAFLRRVSRSPLSARRRRARIARYYVTRTCRHCTTSTGIGTRRPLYDAGNTRRATCTHVSVCVCVITNFCGGGRGKMPRRCVRRDANRDRSLLLFVRVVLPTRIQLRRPEKPIGVVKKKKRKMEKERTSARFHTTSSTRR